MDRRRNIMLNFTFCSPTEFLFGRDTEGQAGERVRAHGGTRALVHYGGGSVERSGLLARVLRSLEAASVPYVTLGGAVPNPRSGLVYEGIELCRREGVDFVLCVGGGSAIDSGKAIALGMHYDGDFWDFYSGKAGAPAHPVLPVGVVLTIPAAGSEGSTASVITQEDGMFKRGYGCEQFRPRFAIMNPELTCTLPPFQTACGVSDMMCHIMERYFTKEPHVELTDELCEGALRAIIRNARRIFSGGESDYNARAEIMWAGTLAHNNILGTGRIGDWASHGMSHEPSAIFDLAHGAALSILFPAWAAYNVNEEPRRFARFAAKVWGVDGAYYDLEQAALEGVFRMKNFFRSIGLPVTFADANIDSSRFSEMAQRAVKFGPVGNLRKLEAKDIEAIYHLAAK